MSENETEWEGVGDGLFYGLSRFKVEGGHIYRDYSTIGDYPVKGMCFVPDVDLTRYQAHLRDAYNQGFKDGMEEGKAHV